MRWLSLTLTTVAAVTLAACGGGSDAPPAPGTPQHPLVATTQAPTVGSEGAKSASGTSARSNEGASTAAKGTAKSAGTKAAPAEVGAPENPGYESLLKQQKADKGRRFTPCSLVSETRAAQILGGPIQQPVLAPQGPTCIYRSRDGKGFVTVAVQRADIARLQRQVKHPQRFVLSGRTAYCGTLGQPVLYVALKSGRVLSIAGPCGIARQFAASAVPQLS
jgi:hypothetical protein